MTEEDIDGLPSIKPSTLSPPPVITPTQSLNWPTSQVAQTNFFEQALANGGLTAEADETVYEDGLEAMGAQPAADDWGVGDTAEGAEEEPEQEGEGWDLDAPEAEEDEVEIAGGEDDEGGAGAKPGVPETEYWLRNSPFAGDHAAAGSFETATQVSCHSVFFFFLVAFWADCASSFSTGKSASSTLPLSNLCSSLHIAPLTSISHPIPPYHLFNFISDAILKSPRLVASCPSFQEVSSRFGQKCPKVGGCSRSTSLRKRRRC